MSRPKFKVELKIQELSNIPQVIGEVYVKWYLKDSPKPDARGKTHQAPINKGHRALWDYEGITQVRIGVDRRGMLKESLIIFDMLWEHAGGTRVSLGKVDLNLAEYLNRDFAWETHRYLLKESKINCVLSVQLMVTQITGPSDYTVPEFKAPQVFGNITGVIDEQKARQELKSSGASTGSSNHSIERKSSSSVLSKLYHKSFAVSWDPVPGYLNPEDCVENIFSGGDGFGELDVYFPEQSLRRMGKHANSTSTTTTNSSRKASISMGDAAHIPSNESFEADEKSSEGNLIKSEQERQDYKSWVIRVQ